MAEEMSELIKELESRKKKLDFDCVIMISSAVVSTILLAMGILRPQDSEILNITFLTALAIGLFAVPFSIWNQGRKTVLKQIIESRL
jgi:hypothetical protein